MKNVNCFRTTTNIMVSAVKNNPANKRPTHTS